MNELNDKRIVVIGGAGFIGSHIVDQLLDEPVAEVVVFDNFVRGKLANLEAAQRDARVRVVQGSITDVPALSAVLDGADYAFHLAALWLGECVNDPRSAVDVNVVGTWNVVETAQVCGLKKVVFSSSASVYGSALSTPMTEEHPFNNRTMYGATKIAGEQFFRANYEQKKLDYAGLRYMNVYGPRMDYRGTYVSVIMKVLDRIEQGLAPVVFGDGLQSYDFIHVSDVARANILALKSDITDDFLNVGMGVRTTINELVEQLLALTQSTLRIEYRPSEQSFVTNRLGSTDRAERLIGFRAAVPLEEGLRSVVAWRVAERKPIPA